MEARNIAFYKFTQIEDPESLCGSLKRKVKELGLRGTILIATEGINGMLSGENKRVETFQTFLSQDPRFSDIQFKISYSDFIPFKKVIIKVKPEVLTLGMPEIKPGLQAAPYIEPEELSEALSKNENIVLIDIRNNFEVEHGTFENAINPKTNSFSEFPEFAKNLELDKDQKIVTFCTGGIRCEKGALVLQHAGFKNVYQLNGGILDYFTKILGAPHFKGKCFVFDERETLKP